MKRFYIVLIAILLTSGCKEDTKYSDEKMYDIAAKLKDTAKALDGFAKFSDLSSLSDQEMLLQAVKNNPEQLSVFEDYQLLVDIQGSNAVLMLCDGEKALIEDAGCNLDLDKIYWQQQNNSCVITLKAKDVCD